MMLRLFCLIVLVVVGRADIHGQQVADTLEVSKDYKTIVIFPMEIADIIPGKDSGFSNVLPRQDGSRFSGRIMKLYYDDLSPETEDITNYTVITQSGNLYEFILVLTKVPKQRRWLITPEMAQVNIDGKSVNELTPNFEMESSDMGGKEMVFNTGKSVEKLPDYNKPNSIDRATKELYESNPTEYYRLRCYYMQFDKAKISRFFTRLDNVFLWLKGVYYNEDELYFQFRIENKEGLDMDINFIKFHLATNYKNSSSNQRIELKPIFRFKQPQTVAGKSENHFVVVIKKFALDEKKELVLELDEESGNRNLSLKIGHEIINNPIHF